ncbi:sulfatase-like hydrolase/transferase [Planctomycetota bacterium]
MNRREFIKAVTGTAAGLLLSGPGLSEEAAKRRPNVVLIVSDNQRPDTIAALGNKYIKTPNLDKLVREGAAFNNAYFMGSTSGATCMPSRTMLMTGRTLFNCPLTEMCEEAEAANPITGVATLPKTLKDADYNTLRTGKMGNYPRFAAQEFHKNIIVARSPNGSERHANNAIEFVREQNSENPFFLYVALAAPNDPHVGPGTAPKEYMDMYKPGDVPVPPNYLPMHPFDNGEMVIRDELLAPWPRTKEVIEEHLAGFYSVITYMDHEIGRIIDALKETGQYENTIIIFAADTGTAIGSHGLIGMQNLYEHSVGVPLIICGPGIPAGKRSDALVYLYDLFPTICELSGIAIPGGVDGRSLVAIMEGKENKVRDSLFTAYKDVQRSVRDERWKLIRYPKVKETQLFDLQNDPDEMKNLAEEPAYAAKVKEMMAMLRKWQKKVADNAPL